MKASEEMAFLYLSSLGLSPIVYEPDGNMPPDFLTNGRIAIEVRRLNYHKVTESGGPRGIESSQFALLRSMREILPSLGPPKKDESWFVHYTFSRPVLKLAKLKRAVLDLLTAFRDGQIEGREFSITDHFTVKMIPSTKVFPDCFVLGGYVDRDAGGWTIAELDKNIRICIREKSEKIAKVRAKYPKWWLILVDHIGYGQRESLHIEHDWDKVILVNPLDPKIGYEI